MGRPSIVEKLEKMLLSPIDSEIQVLYLLVELRKLLEHDNQKGCIPSPKLLQQLGRSYEAYQIAGS